MTSATPLTYLKLKTADASKLGRSGGRLQFLILADIARQHLYLAITGNQGGGYYSSEAVAFDAIEGALPLDRAATFPAKVFAPCFKGRSSNNPGFLAAILRSLDLLRPVPDKPHLHAVAGGWPAWKASMLDLDGEPYVPPVKAGVVAVPSAPFDAAPEAPPAPALDAAAPVQADVAQDEPGPADPVQAVSELPEPLRARRKGGKLKDTEPRHPTLPAEASDHAHPA